MSELTNGRRFFERGEWSDAYRLLSRAHELAAIYAYLRTLSEPQQAQ